MSDDETKPRLRVIRLDYQGDLPVVPVSNQAPELLGNIPHLVGLLMGPDLALVMSPDEAVQVAFGLLSCGAALGADIEHDAMMSLYRTIAEARSQKPHASS